ncbi:MAG: formate dehydrogenase [Methylococcales bacterium]|nr:MAG: formate dehydrogenase [Methylococcales bacterium]
MKIKTLIKMANSIGDFFNADSDKELAANGVKNHITRTWEPRMRKELIAYYHQDGSELSELVKTAVSGLESV